MTLTPTERAQVKRIRDHISTIEYRSTSATYIHQLIRIVERLTQDEVVERPRGEVEDDKPIITLKEFD
jgi:hypothetical protein